MSHRYRYDFSEDFGYWARPFRNHNSSSQREVVHVQARTPPRSQPPPGKADKLSGVKMNAELDLQPECYYCTTMAAGHDLRQVPVHSSQHVDETQRRVRSLIQAPMTHGSMNHPYTHTQEDCNGGLVAAVRLVANLRTDGEGEDLMSDLVDEYLRKHSANAGRFTGEQHLTAEESAHFQEVRTYDGLATSQSRRCTCENRSPVYDPSRQTRPSFRSQTRSDGVKTESGLR